MGEREFLTAVCAFDLFGPSRVKLLTAYFKSAKNVWKASFQELLSVGLKRETVLKFVRYRENFNIPDYFTTLEKLGIKIISISEKAYPVNLKGLTDAPLVIYVRGTLKHLDSNAVAIVGSRMMTSYGREVAGKLASELASFGVTIVSGLALGVDAEAQRSALSSGGRTIAVLASGLDTISPLANRALALEFIKENGALISENPLGHMPFRGDFAYRNRLISGLSKAVIVIEGRMKSGTFYTVNAALNQGRPVFAVPGQITSPASEAPNYLIQNGAKLITSARDVLEELDMQIRVDREKMDKVLPGGKLEEKLMKIFETEPRHLDEVVRISGLKTSDISTKLTIMEMKGLIKNLGGGIYKRI